MTAARKKVDYDQEISVGFQLRKTFRKTEALLRRQIESEGISISVWYYLRVLWERDGLKQRELAQLVGRMQPTTVNALRKMRRSGLVRMEADRADKRALRIYLTAKSRRLRNILLPRVAAINGVVLKGISAHERSAFMRTLRKIQRNTGI